MTGAAASWLDRLAVCGDAPARAALLSVAPPGETPVETARRIQERLVACLYSDRAAATRLEQAGVAWAAAYPAAPAPGAYACRGTAHVAYVSGHYEDALRLYGEAAAAFAAAHLPQEQARTLSSALQSLILLSRYDQAHAWAAQAAAIFRQHGDQLRLARLDSNIGNIYFRQDRARDAVDLYQRALAGFQAAGGDPKDSAAVLSNLAVVYTNLGEFQDALTAYQQARELAGLHGLLPLVAQADYNIAYLHFLRGDYAIARRLYQRTRQECEASGDAYHLALCDLDEAELSLELNLTEDGEVLAARAVERFAALGMRYERAKALVSLAVAGSQKGDLRQPDRQLMDARRLFVEEQNLVWPALIDLLRANLAFRDGRDTAAKRLCGLAWRKLADSRMPGRAAHCQILQGRLWLRAGLADRARATSRDLLARLGDDAAPPLRFHARLLEGEAEEASGRWRDALRCYESARRELEDLRGRLDSEDLRISLLKDKHAVYDGLVHLLVESPLAAEPGAERSALLVVQQAKSRSLADRLLHAGSSAAQPDSPGAPGMDRLRTSLNSCYRQIELAALMARAGNPAAPVAELKAKARALEAEIVRLRALQPPAARDSVLAPASTAEELCAAVDPASILLEYFECRGQLYLFLVTRHHIRLHPLGPIQPIRQTLKLMQFQMGRYRVQPQGGSLAQGLPAVRHHLASLQQALLGPACHELRQFERWIVAPHRQLHGVPFAALEQDGGCVLDRVNLCHLPSASVLAAIRQRQRATSGARWVIAVPDPRNPSIEPEARQVASLLPGAQLVMGKDATSHAFRHAGRDCAVLHLAAHGVFRRDNPLFSSIELADGRLNLMDLGRTDLNAGLVVLSACSTGRAVSVGGDELLGLVRGFLSAGAHNLLVSLWEVDDENTAQFMSAFYRRLATNPDIALALREASAEIRQSRPHPYYWAPFILVGTGEI